MLEGDWMGLGRRKSRGASTEMLWKPGEWRELQTVGKADAPRRGGLLQPADKGPWGSSAAEGTGNIFPEGKTGEKRGKHRWDYPRTQEKGQEGPRDPLA